MFFSKEILKRVVSLMSVIMLVESCVPVYAQPMIHIDNRVLDTENLDTENLDTENLDTENLDTENLDTENLNRENLDTENLDKENLDKENLDTENYVLEDIIDCESADEIIPSAIPESDEIVSAAVSVNTLLPERLNYTREYGLLGRSLPVYKYESIEDNKFSQPLDSRSVLGYATLSENGSACFDTLDDSNSTGEVNIPRIIVVSHIDGEPVTSLHLFDYSDGFRLNPSGNRLNSDGTEYYPPVSSKDEEKPDHEFIGEFFNVTEIKNGIFSNCEHAQIINIPWTVTSDIDYTFFKGLDNLREINIKNPSHEANLQGRYISKKTNEDGTKGVLVDLWVGGNSTAKAKIVFCPPHYPYKYYKLYNTGENIIGSHAFENCTNLETVSSINPVFQRVTRIDEYAFAGCTDLENLPRFFTEPLTKIGDRAFADCVKLKNVDFTPSIGTELGSEVFMNTAIETLSLPVGYNAMSGSTFRGMTKLKSIETPSLDAKHHNGYFEARDGVLYRRSDLNSDFDNGVTMVCFPPAKTVSAENIDMGGTVPVENAFMVPYQVKDFDDYCFENNTLQTIYFPGGLNSISPKTICSCANIRNLYFYSGLPGIYNGNNDDWESFKENTDLFSLCNTRYITVFAGKDTPIYDYVSSYTDSAGRKMKLEPLYDAKKLYFEVNPSNQRASSTANLKGIDPSCSELVNPYTLVVPYYVYLNNSGEAVDFNEGGSVYTVTGLDSCSVADDRLTKIRLLNSIKDVADDAFVMIKNPDEFNSPENHYCNKLTGIYTEAGNKYIESLDGVLYKHRWDDDSKKYSITGLLAYPAGKTDESYTTKPLIEYIPKYAFWGASNLRYVNIFDSVEFIGTDGSIVTENDENACFAGCDNLVAVNIIPNTESETLASDIHYYSKDGVLYTTNFREPENPKKNALIFYPKGTRTFERDGLSPIAYTVDERCRSIRDVKNCKNLRKITVPKGVEIIEPNAFEGDVVLAEVEYQTSGNGNGIRSIGDRAFYGTGLQSVSMPDTIRQIGNEAFADCQQLKEVFIAGDVLEKIGRKAFYGDRYIETVSVNGTNPSRLGGDAVIGQSAFEGLSSLRRFSMIRMGEVTLSENVLFGNSLLKELSVSGTNIISMGERAFAQCSELTAADLSSSISLYAISPQSFYNCRNLKEVRLPVRLKSIGSEAFSNCTSLDTINSKGLTKLNYVGDEAFAGTAFRSFYFPELSPSYSGSVPVQEKTRLGKRVFKNNTVIKSIFLPDTVDFTEYLYLEPTNNGPFFNLGPSVTVYASANSSVIGYFAMLDEYGFEYHPAFSMKTNLPVVSITLNPSEITIFDKGDNTRKLTAVITVSGDLTDNSLIWKSLDTSVAVIAGDVVSDGVNTYSVTIQGISKGTTQISVLNEETGEMAFAAVTVLETTLDVGINPTSPDTVSGMSVSGNFRLNTKGSNRSVQLNVVTKPVMTVYYKSEDKKLVKVSKNGKITAGKLPKGQKEAVTQVICYAGSKEDNSYTESVVNVTVCKPSISLQKKKVVLSNGGNLENVVAYLTVSHDGAYENVKWTTKKRSVATVSGDDNGCTITGIAKGTTTIFAECNGLKAKCKVKVTDAGITIDTDYVELYTGGANGDDEYQIRAKTTQKGKKAEVIWASTDDKVATVNEKGLVTAMGGGVCHVTATSNGVTATCVVKVFDRKVKILGTGSEEGRELTELFINSEGDNTYQLDYDIEGEKPNITWSSDKPGVASVDRFGFVTAVTPGDCIIYAEANGAKAGIKVHVLDTYLKLTTSANKAAESVNLGINQQYLFNAEFSGADSSLNIEWEIADSAIAEIVLKNDVKADSENASSGYSGKGSCIVKGIAPGTTRIKVKANGITKECIIIVK